MAETAVLKEGHQQGDPRLLGARRAWGAVGVLGLALFAFVSTEPMPVGLLPSIARGVDVPVGQAGFLVTGFAFVVAVAATPMTMLLRRVDRRTLVGILLGACTVGNVLTAVSVNYWMLMASRVVVALACGARKVIAAGSRSGVAWAGTMSA